MRLSFGLEQKLVQKQVLAPRMIQSMEILQLPIMALQERIDQEMSENPLLEVHEKDLNLPDEPVETEAPDAPSSEERELVVDEKNSEADFERLLQLDKDVPDHFDEMPRRSINRMEEEGDRKHDAIANITSRPHSLHDHLNDQLGELNLDAEIRAMAELIIYNLDPNGYLTGRLEDVLPPDTDDDKIALLGKALSVVQSLEPAGIGARDLRECLLLQLVPEMPMYDELKTIISSHLQDLADNRLPMIERKAGYSIEQIQEVWGELKRLDGKPGAAFSASLVPTITPDVMVEKNEKGEYVVRLEDGRTPSLRISEHYKQRWASGKATQEEKEFIKRKVNSAQWLIESIHQRRNTLTRVAQAIVDHQTRFLEDGPEHVEPLKMQQIAEKVGVHVTTVSRAVDDKWMQTPRGIYALRRFFVGGTISADGEEVAWDAIRVKLQELVDNEDKSSPYSDDDLVKELQRQGFKVARRTITKYRKKMNIPSSRQRRDWSKRSNGQVPKNQNGQP